MSSDLNVWFSGVDVDASMEHNRVMDEFDLSPQLLERLGLWHNGKIEYEMVMDRFIESEYLNVVPDERKFVIKTGKNQSRFVHKYPYWYSSSFWGHLEREPKTMGSGSFGGNFAPQIPIMAIKRFTHRGDLVIDRFAGSGTTLDAAKVLDRECIGIDLYPRREGYLSEMPNRKTTLVVMHPPYADLSVVYGDKIHKSKKKELGDSDFSKGRGLSIPPEEFLLEFKKILDTDVTPNLTDGGHVCLVIGNGSRGGKIFPLASRTADLFSVNYDIKHIIVKHVGDWTEMGNRAMWEYRALAHGGGMIEHEYVYIFKKKQQGA